MECFLSGRYFDASDNDLTGSLPENFMANSIFASNESVTVFLQHNEITGTVPSSLHQFTDLNINLAGNRITGIPPELCDRDQWNDGNVGVVGDCSAILCPAGTFNQFGKQSPANPCLSCSHLKDVTFLGQTRCANFTSERVTLSALYEATGGEFWNSSTSWLSEAPICSWKGVLCEDGDLQDTKGVTSIKLADNGLVGSLPSVIWTLPSLRVLNIQSNPRLEVNFNGIHNAATHLEVLDVSHVKMTSLHNVAYARSLKELHVAGNNLKGTDFFVLFCRGNEDELDAKTDFFNISIVILFFVDCRRDVTE